LRVACTVAYTSWYHVRHAALHVMVPCTARCPARHGTMHSTLHGTSWYHAQHAPRHASQATRKGWPYYTRGGRAAGGAVVYSRATPCGWPARWLTRHGTMSGTLPCTPARPPARGGPTIHEVVVPLVERSSIVGPPLAGGLHGGLHVMVPCPPCWPARHVMVPCPPCWPARHVMVPCPARWPARHVMVPCPACWLPGTPWWLHGSRWSAASAGRACGGGWGVSAVALAGCADAHRLRSRPRPTWIRATRWRQPLPTRARGRWLAHGRRRASRLQ
jgi:hypothetical protein